jgi:L-ascorbate metabolism protein UlaG (beta-lactamase superfamily)
MEGCRAEFGSFVYPPTLYLRILSPCCKELFMTSFETTLTLVGGPTVLIELAGFRFLTDPTFDEPGIYQSSPTVTLEKTTRPALTADEIGAVDAVLLSHDQHFDNLDRAGRVFLPRARTTYTTPVGAGRLGGNAVGLAPWESARLEGAGAAILVTATPARHGPPGIEPISGDVAGFLLGLSEPGDAIYFAGDTVWYEGVAEVARRYKPKLVILNTGSAEPRGRFHVTMDANDALEAAHAFPQAKIVGVHNEGWRHFAETADDLAHAFKALGVGERLQSLDRGKPMRLSL